LIFIFKQTSNAANNSSNLLGNIPLFHPVVLEKLTKEIENLIGASDDVELNLPIFIVIGIFCFDCRPIRSAFIETIAAIKKFVLDV
jgi:hypothetical protein